MIICMEVKWQCIHDYLSHLKWANFEKDNDFLSQFIFERFENCTKSFLDEQQSKPSMLSMGVCFPWLKPVTSQTL